MASKLNMMGFLQQVKGVAAITQRCRQPQPTGWLVLQSRSSSRAAQQRLTLSIDAQNLQDNPYPVSIIHVKRTAPAPTPPG